MTKLEITITHRNGSATIYNGQAEGFLDQVKMTLSHGRPVLGYDHTEPASLQIHAALCRSAVWKVGLDTKEHWTNPFDR